MAERGDPGDHPLGKAFNKKKASQKKQLTRGDVGNQGRVLLTRFIHDRMVNDGFAHPLEEGELVPPETPTGPPIEHIREVAVALRYIGDDLDCDQQLQGLIKQIPPDAPRQTFLNVAREIFSDGNYNWGRVVALFYFAYKMVVKTIQSVLNQLPVIRGIIEWVVDFIYENLAPWIISRGGWESVQEYFGSTRNQAAGVLVCGFVLTAAFIAWKYYKS